jgi:hypothetical protein
LVFQLSTAHFFFKTVVVDAAAVEVAAAVAFVVGLEGSGEWTAEMGLMDLMGLGWWVW